MPYPNEHAFRLKDPETIDKIKVKRTNGSEGSSIQGTTIPESVSVIWFITEENGKEIPVAQSLRFPVDKWTETSAKKFITENKLKGKFEASEKKEDVSGTITVYRSDNIHSQKIGSIKRTDEGYLTGIAPVAKVGVMSYLLNDGSIRKELVTDETLFNFDFMETLKMKPITDSHPREGAVNSINAKDRKVGFTGETVKQDGKYLITSLTITDNDSIKNIDNGKRELSPGYECDLLLQSGEFEGEKYDAIQIKRTYNHLALCDKARGGSDIKLNLDSEDIEGYEITDLYREEKNDNSIILNSNGGRFMETYKLDGIEYNADKQVINHIDKKEKEIEELTSEKETLQGKLDSMTEELDKFRNRNIDEEIDNAVKERRTFEVKAGKYLDSEEVEKLPEMKKDEIEKKIILKAFPKVNLDEKSGDYIKARFDSAIEILDFEKKNDGIKKQREQANNNFKNDSNSEEVDSEKSRQEMLKRDSELWKSE